MEDVSSLKVAQQLNSTINQLYEETIQRLEGALQSVCNDFHANQYIKVGPYVFGGHLRIPGDAMQRRGKAHCAVAHPGTTQRRTAQHKTAQNGTEWQSKA